MTDSTDGFKVRALENVNAKYSDSVTVSNNDSLVYVKAPEFIEPIIMNTPRYSPPINPDYIKLAKIAYDTVLQAMLEGEREHGPDSWKEQCITCHMRHAEDHIEHAILGYSDENHIAHAMARCAMIKYLEENKQMKELQNEV